MKTRTPKKKATGDWTPPFREITLFSREEEIDKGILRNVLEEQGFKVHDNLGTLPGEISYNRGEIPHGSPYIVLNVKSKPLGKGKSGRGVLLGNPNDYIPEVAKLYRSGILHPRDLGKLTDLRGKVVLCLGGGLGTYAMANAAIKAGAVAYIGTTATRPAGNGAWILFIRHFFFETWKLRAPVKEAWERANAINRETRKFQLFVPGPGRAGASSACVAIPLREIAYPRNPPLKTGGQRIPDWKFAGNELDLLTIRSNYFDFAKTTLRLMLEEFGLKVNVFPCRNEAEIKERLGGKGLTAPLVLITGHGGADARGKSGFIIQRNGWKTPIRIMNADQVARCIHLPERVVIANCCGFGNSDMVKTFLKGQPKAYIAGGGNGLNAMFLLQFLHELAVHGSTLKQALDRVKAYRETVVVSSGKWKPEVPARNKTQCTQAPALIEGFEGRTANRVTWESGFLYGWLVPASVPAPQDRPGLAYKVHFDFTMGKCPGLLVEFPGDGTRWTGARGLSAEVYVPRDMKLRRRLKLIFAVAGKQYEYAVKDIGLRPGWNLVRLPFDSPHWRGKERKAKVWRRESFNLDRLQPVSFIWIALPGYGRRDSGSVYFDNLRLEK